MASAQDSSIGFAPEVTFGTFVAPTRFLEFLDEGLDLNKEIKQGQGLRVGRRVDASGRRVEVARDIGGPVKIEAVSKGLGLWWQFLLGSGTSTLVSGTTYQQVFTLADVMPMISIQRGLPRYDGTVACHSFTGCTAKGFEIDFPTKDLITVNADIDGRNFDTSQAYTSPTYAASPNVFSFAGSTISTGALTAPTSTTLATAATPIANIRGGSIKVEHNLVTDDFRAGNAGKKSRQAVGKRSITSKLTVVHDQAFDWVAAINNETPLSQIWTWTGGALSTGVETLQIVIPELKAKGSMPHVNGPDLITHDIELDGLDNLTAAQPIWVVVRTADAAL
jgi:hypothetical protein